MNCLICGTKCGTLETPMQYLYIEQDGRRNDVEGFCSEVCAHEYLKQNPSTPVERCVHCNGVIINAPWFPTFNSRRPFHHDCLPEADSDTVVSGDGCKCGENRVDYLIWDEAGETISCFSCGNVYTPSEVA